MDWRILAACGCHIGRRREKNEDNFLFDGISIPSENRGLGQILTKECTPDAGRFFAVFDGMGGGDYGEIAACKAAETARQSLYTGGNFPDTDSEAFAGSLARMCEEMNGAVFQSGAERNSYTMGTTLAGLLFRGQDVWSCNVGDSRNYLLREGILRQISRDHTDETYMRQQGISGRKPFLTQYLGMDPEEIKIAPEIRRIPLHEKEGFLICSDGVTDMLCRETLEAILQETPEPKECVQQIIDAALEAGGKDNITAIVIRVL